MVFLDCLEATPGIQDRTHTVPLVSAAAVKSSVVWSITRSAPNDATSSTTGLGELDRRGSHGAGRP
jgi:hypothetical protein